MVSRIQSASPSNVAQEDIFGELEEIVPDLDESNYHLDSHPDYSEIPLSSEWPGRLSDHHYAAIEGLIVGPLGNSLKAVEPEELTAVDNLAKDVVAKIFFFLSY